MDAKDRDKGLQWKQQITVTHKDGLTLPWRESAIIAKYGYGMSNNISNNLPWQIQVAMGERFIVFYTGSHLIWLAGGRHESRRINTKLQTSGS